MPDPEPTTLTGGTDLFGWVSPIAEKTAAFALMVAGLFMTVVPIVGIFTDVWSKVISLGIYVAALVAGRCGLHYWVGFFPLAAAHLARC
jgi:hypothetical protein